MSWLFALRLLDASRTVLQDLRRDEVHRVGSHLRSLAGSGHHLSTKLANSQPTSCRPLSSCQYTASREPALTQGTAGTYLCCAPLSSPGCQDPECDESSTQYAARAPSAPLLCAACAAKASAAGAAPSAASTPQGLSLQRGCRLRVVA